MVLLCPGYRCRKWRCPVDTLTQTVQTLSGLFGLGRIPHQIREELEAESPILLVAEGIAEVAVFRNFKSPVAYCRRKRTLFVGYFVLSEERLVVKAGSYNKISVNMRYDDPPFQNIAFTATSRLLSLSCDASVASPQMAGQIEVRLHLPDVGTAADILQAVGAQIEFSGTA